MNKQECIKIIKKIFDVIEVRTQHLSTFVWIDINHPTIHSVCFKIDPNLGWKDYILYYKNNEKDYYTEDKNLGDLRQLYFNHSMKEVINE